MIIYAKIGGVVGEMGQWGDGDWSRNLTTLTQKTRRFTPHNHETHAQAAQIQTCGSSEVRVNDEM